MSVLAAVAALVPALLLAAAGAGHARRRAALSADLAAHGVLGPGARAAVTPVLPAVELLVGLGVAGTLALGSRTGLLAALAAQTLLLAAFARYLAVAARSGAAGLPCGCGLPEVPVGPGAVARAAALGLLTVAALATSAGPWWQGPPRDAAEVVLVAAAAPTLALLLAVVQPARRRPAPHPTPRGAVS